MPCLKCGAKIKRFQAFCEECRESMENYPVKPGTPIQLPTHEERPATKKRPSPRKKELKPEDQIRRLRSANRWLVLMLLVALLAFGVTAILTLRLLEERDSGTTDIGKNYRSAYSWEMDCFT